MPDQGPFSGWAIVELMGHRRIAGFVQEVQIAGMGLLRVDVSGHDGPLATQFYAPAAIYCITPTTEAMVDQISGAWEPPVKHWELPALSSGDGDPDDDDNEDPLF